MKKILLLLILLLLTSLIWSQNLSLTGVDASGLMRSQKVDLYLTLTDDGGNPLEAGDLDALKIYESIDGDNYTERSDTEIDRESNLREGIDIFLMVDNSGSMYYDLQGKPTDNDEDRRMVQVEKALDTFIRSIKDSRDRISLASFNTRFTLLSEGTSRKGEILDAFNRIEEPEEEEAYTELFAALTEAAPVLSEGSRGRKVIVVLSDGENFSYYQSTGKMHPLYQARIFTPEESVEALQREGITLFAVNYGTSGDPNLAQIARETGGKTFDASSSAELAGIYDFIREALLKEVRVTYRAGVYNTDRVWVRVETPGDDPLERFYYASGLFGGESPLPWWIVLLILFLSVGLWLLLMSIRFEKRRNLPNLEIVGGGLHQKVLDLTKDRTVIGNSNSHDLTLAGNAVEEEKQSATIIYDEKKNNYTLVAEDATMVNNQEVTRKELQTGDVIKIGDSLIIFDDEATKLQG